MRAVACALNTNHVLFAGGKSVGFFAICHVTKKGPAVFASPQSCDNHLGHMSGKALIKASSCEHCVASHHVEEMYCP